MTMGHARGASRQKGSAGFILVAVLWILAALATLAAIFSIYLANTAVSLSVNDNDIQTEALVYAGLELTAYQVSSPNNAASSGAPAQPNTTAAAPQARLRPG